MHSDRCDANSTSRREFLQQLSAGIAGSALAGGMAFGAGQASRATAESAGALPTIRLGNHEVTRLVVGANPIGGYSYLGTSMDQEMREYFTPERVVAFLA